MTFVQSLSKAIEWVGKIALWFFAWPVMIQAKAQNESTEGIIGASLLTVIWLVGWGIWITARIVP